MNKYKELGLKILYPNVFVFILLFVVGFGSVISVFLFDLSTHWFAYIAYVLSAYALTITVARSIKLIRWIRKKLHSNKYTNRLLTDRDLKDRINLFSGTFFNTIYGVFKVVTGFIYRSVWFGSTGVYYIILGMMKLALTKLVVKNASEDKQISQYKNTGILMFLLNIVMVGMIILMLVEGESAVYPGYVIYVQAGYTFYILTSAIINVIKYRNVRTPVIRASKSINLVAGIMSMFVLQIAMVNEFGSNTNMDILNIISGAVTSISTLGIALYMIINSKKITK